MDGISDRPWIGAIHTVGHTLVRAGRTIGYMIGDLLLTDHGPFLVLEWEDRPDGAYPTTAVSLDPAALHALPGGPPTHLYEHPIDDPRPMH